jgi:hypothetical protein
MSKRIMNRFFDILDRNGVPVYMSNTDSILLPSKDVHLLQEHIGTGLGQLHLERSTDEA